MTSGPVTAWMRRNTSLADHLLETSEFEASVHARRRALDLRTDQEYLDLLERDSAEVTRLVASVAVPETWLFRYRESFEYLREDLRDRRESGGVSLRMLCAPCADGSEAFSMIAAAAAAGWTPSRVEVEAVDLDQRLIDHARRGEISRRMQRREGTPQWAESSLVPTDHGVALRPELLARIRFQAADLLDRVVPIAGPFDVVACRNLLIYLDGEARQRLIGRIEEWLRPDGVLLVGHADTVPELAPSFRSVDPAAFAFATRVDAPAGDRPAVALPTHVARPSTSGAATPTGRAPGRARPRSRPRVADPPRVAPEANLSDAVASGDPRRIEQAAAAALDRRRDDLDALMALGRLHAERDPDHAESLFRKVAYLEPTHEAALLALAALAETGGRTDEAERLRSRALRAHLDRDDGAPGRGGDEVQG